MAATADPYVRAASLSELRGKGSISVNLSGHTLVLFDYGSQVYAIDNRCPHMGFPLDRGTVHDGILTCHWHHARFDLASGGTFDQWADDVRAFPTDIRDDDIWVNLAPRDDIATYLRHRLRDGLERNISLVVAKSVIGLLEGGVDPVEPFRIGVEFGVTYRWEGWGQGLTILACMMNLLPYLDAEDRPRALYHGLSAVANNTDGSPPRFVVRPLPLDTTDIPILKRWFRQFIEVRDAEGAERCLISGIRSGADHVQMADMLFAAATDHRYIQIGHVLDFTNKALEALDIVGWEHAEAVLTSLARAYASADRQEEANEWRHPIDLVALLETAFESLPTSREQAHDYTMTKADSQQLINILLSDDPQAIVDALLAAMRRGFGAEHIAQTVAYAAALRIAQFHTSNEFGDWDTALHTFTFAHAVYQGLRRTHSPELLRGVFDAAISVYLDRFLNIPAARLPAPNGLNGNVNTVLDELADLFNRQQQVNQAGAGVAAYLYHEGDPDRLLSLLGHLLLREDRDFHTIQCVEAAFLQYALLREKPESVHVLVAAARYLAAHAPTMRAQGQTYQIAHRLARGEHLFEEDVAMPASD